MPAIEIQTEINAPVERCFDLSRSVEMHVQSTNHTKEKAIGGVTSGLIGIGESVTWRARHFGVWQEFTSKVTELERPVFFVDQMSKGIFKFFRHEHHFQQKEDDRTLMIDVLQFQSPFGILGRFANQIFLKIYLTKFLSQRNNLIKEIAESDKWRIYLNSG